MQQAIDSKPDVGIVTSGFNVNITRTLFKRVLKQPIHDVNDVFIVRIRAGHFAQLDQLLKVANTRTRAVALCSTDGAVKRIKFQPKPFNVFRSGEYFFNFASCYLLNGVFPASE